MSEHMRNNDHAAKKSRRGGKRLAVQQAEPDRRRKALEGRPEPVSAPAAV